jgi:hypothetical protein
LDHKSHSSSFDVLNHLVSHCICKVPLYSKVLDIVKLEDTIV